MKRCLNCNTTFLSIERDCPNCGSIPSFVDGFEAYAPEFSHGGGGFKCNYFSDLAELEDQNFWFQSRNRLILWALESYLPSFQSFLEVGCGTGYVLSGVSKTFPQATLCGSEIFTAGLGYAASRLPGVKFIQMDARNIPFSKEFDVIGAFDVLEHIEEDELALNQFCDALKPDGWLLLTVPQHDWLWSPVDEYACHVRRYSASELHTKIKEAGFQIIRSTSFVTTLLPAMIISRFLQKRAPDKQFDAAAEFKISPILNSVFFRLLGAELAIIKKGVNFSAGGSRLVVAKKI